MWFHLKRCLESLLQLFLEYYYYYTYRLLVSENSNMRFETASIATKVFFNLFICNYHFE